MKNKKIVFQDMNIREIEYISFPKHMIDENKEYFCFSVSGNGMINVGIKDNDIVVFEAVDYLDDADIGCVIVDGQPMCKRYFYNKDYRLHILQYEDGKQPPILVDEKQSFKILGKLVMKLNKL